MIDWALLASLAAVIGVPLTVVGLIYVARQQAREQATKRSDELQAKYNDGYTAGMAHVAPELNLMRSQRDDARRDRDRAEARADSADRRIETLEDQLRRTT